MRPGGVGDVLQLQVYLAYLLICFGSIVHCVGVRDGGH